MFLAIVNESYNKVTQNNQDSNQSISEMFSDAWDLFSFVILNKPISESRRKRLLEEVKVTVDEGLENADVNKDGRFDRAEIIQFVRELGGEDPQALADYFMKKFDKNGDQFLAEDEIEPFKAYVREELLKIREQNASSPFGSTIQFTPEVESQVSSQIRDQISIMVSEYAKAAQEYRAGMQQMRVIVNALQEQKIRLEDKLQHVTQQMILAQQAAAAAQANADAVMATARNCSESSTRAVSAVQSVQDLFSKAETSNQTAFRAAAQAVEAAQTAQSAASSCASHVQTVEKQVASLTSSPFSASASSSPFSSVPSSSIFDDLASVSAVAVESEPEAPLAEDSLEPNLFTQ